MTTRNIETTEILNSLEEHGFDTYSLHNKDGKLEYFVEYVSSSGMTYEEPLPKTMQALRIFLGY